MTPGIWNGKIVTVNQQGTLMIIHAASGSVEAEVSTAGMQPVALAPSIQGDRAVFSGRKGTVVCVDLATQTVLWERDLSGGSISVFSDPECSSQGVYIFAGNTLHGLSVSDGSDLFSPIRGVTGPPLYKNGKLYYGSQSGGLTVADAASGAPRGGVESRKIITTRPTENGISIIAGTEDGTILVMSP